MTNFHSKMCVWMDLTMILPSPNFGDADAIDQEHSAMKEDLRLVNLIYPVC